MRVFAGTVPPGVTVEYATRYGVMRLRRVREDGMGELQAVKGTMTLFAPINGLGKPSVVLEEEMGSVGGDDGVDEKMDKEAKNDKEAKIDNAKNDKEANDKEAKNDNEAKIDNAKNDNEAKIDNIKIDNDTKIDTTKNDNTTNALSGVGSDIGSSDDEMAEVSLLPLSPLAAHRAGAGGADSDDLTLPRSVPSGPLSARAGRADPLEPRVLQRPDRPTLAAGASQRLSFPFLSRR